MQTIKHLTEQNLINIAEEIEFLTTKEENELLSMLGRSTYSLGIDVSIDSKSIFELSDFDSSEFSVLKSMSRLPGIMALSDETAQERGRGFYSRLKEKIKHNICESPTIKKHINGELSLKDALLIFIPSLLITLGVSSVLAPLILSIVSVVLALILKSGLEAYCNL